MNQKSTQISSLPKKMLSDYINNFDESLISPFKFNDLMILNIKYIDFESRVKTGKLMILDRIAEKVLDIFDNLYLLKFPIARMELMENFNYDDDLAMEENNTSAFNYRFIKDSSTLSIHSYGLAIDINPLQNPCIISKNNDEQLITPSKGVNYLDRSYERPGMVEKINSLFAKHGFTWGGSWTNPIDYHHFQIDRNKINALY